MVWRGRLLGMLIGIWMPIPMGWLLGFLLGWLLYDRPRNKAIFAGQQFLFGGAKNATMVYGTFALLGYVARGDGSIKREHIALAENTMNMMRLTPEGRARAIAAFNRGKSNDFDLDLEIENLNQALQGNRIIISYVLEFLVQMALVDAKVEPEEHRRLCAIAERMGVAEMYVDALIKARLDQMRFHQSGYYYYGGNSQSGYGEEQNSGYDEGASYGNAAADSSKLADAYALLGVSEDASWEEVRKAHKRLMLKYHPDRLKSQGIPEEMIRTYTDKAKDIQAAFDLIKRTRGEKN